MYACGQFGLVLGGYGILRLFSSFFVARGVSGLRLFPDYIYQNDLFGFFTAAGLILALSRLVDTGAGVVSGWYSDRGGSRSGRRQSMMRVAAVPIALFSVLVFFPPSTDNAVLNSVVICLYSLAFFVSFSLYAIPYLALISELGVRAKDRLQLSTLMAFATAFASLAGNRELAAMELVYRLTGLEPLTCFRLVVSVYALVAAGALLLPALFIAESLPADSSRVNETFSASVGAVLADRLLTPYLAADFAWRMASTITMTGFLYYVTVLLALPSGRADYFLLMVFAVNIALYYPVYLVAAKYGKKRLLAFAFLALLVDLALLVPAGHYPVPSDAQGWILSLLFAFPLSVFSVVPYALVGDLAVACERKTGMLRGGMYFGLHSFLTRFAQMCVILVFPLFVSGTSPAPLGLRITLGIAAFFALAGFVAAFSYREKEVSVLFE